MWNQKGIPEEKIPLHFQCPARMICTDPFLSDCLGFSFLCWICVKQVEFRVGTAYIWHSIRVLMDNLPPLTVLTHLGTQVLPKVWRMCLARFRLWMTGGRVKATWTYLKHFHAWQFCLECRLEHGMKRDGTFVQCLLNGMARILISKPFSVSPCGKLIRQGLCDRWNISVQTQNNREKWECSEDSTTAASHGQWGIMPRGCQH